MARHDAARAQAVARRHAKGGGTARQNVEDLCDPGRFIEYGALAIAAQRSRRRSKNIRNTPADGLITGIGAVNGELFGEAQARCTVLAYDYTVLAGTQGTMNHKKTDRMMVLAERERLPVIWFAEGGGGRPGDTDGVGVTGLDVPTFQAFAPAQRPCAPDRHRLGPLFRRQRGVLGLLRRHHRDRELHDRHGRPAP